MGILAGQKIWSNESKLFEILLRSKEQLISVLEMHSRLGWIILKRFKRELEPIPKSSIGNKLDSV